jgi:SynChlorMet cassette protein ScmC
MANGQSWALVASLEAKPWLEKLASIMKLKRGESVYKNKLIFVRSYPRSLASISDVLENEITSDNGWKRDFIGSLSIFSRAGDADLICDLGDEGDENLEYNKMWQALYPIYLHAVASGGLPLHAALVEREGKSYAIAAPGGIGKSTCSRRIPPPWRALCDDEVLIVRDPAGAYQAHPLPTWKEYIYYHSNRTWDVQYHRPLNGIFFLVQSDADGVEPIGGGKATTFIYRSASQVFYKSWLTMNPDNRPAIRVQTFENARRMAKTIPSFLLKASLTGSFWEKIDEAVLRGELAL